MKKQAKVFWQQTEFFDIFNHWVIKKVNYKVALSVFVIKFIKFISCCFFNPLRVWVDDWSVVYTATTDPAQCNQCLLLVSPSCFTGAFECLVLKSALTVAADEQDSPSFPHEAGDLFQTQTNFIKMVFLHFLQRAVWTRRSKWKLVDSNPTSGKVVFHQERGKVVYLPADFGNVLLLNLPTGIIKVSSKNH